MSDPFAVEVPAWLQNAARPWDSREFADAIGTALGGGLKMLFDKQPVLDKQGKPVIDPDTGQPETKHPGLFEAIGEARMNQADPMWRLKAKALETNVMARQAQAAETWQSYQINQKEFEAKAHDLKDLPNQLNKLKTDPFAVPDKPFESTWAQQQWDVSSRAAQRSASAKRLVEQDAAYTATDNATKDVIAQIGKNKNDPNIDPQGWKLDPRTGQRLYMDPDAEQAINDWRKANGLLPIGVTKAQVRPDVKGQSPLGKLEADRQKAVEDGQPQEIIDAYDKAIQNASLIKDTAAIKNINQIAEWDKLANEAEKSGDTEKAKDYRAKATELRDQLKGMNITMGYDDQNRAIFSIGKGTQPTVATQTMAQGKLLQYENATQLMGYLERNITDQHIGLAGTAGEFVVDKTLEQLLPGVANKDRIKARTTLIALRESLLREMSDDRTGRFSVADREEIQKALPSSGVFESKTDAIERIKRVRQILADRGKVYAQRMGQAPPTWTMTEQEIIDSYANGTISKLDPKSPEFKKQFLTKEEANDALVRFYGYHP